MQVFTISNWSDGVLHGWACNSGAQPTLASVAGQPFSGAMRLNNRDTVGPITELWPDTTQVKVSGWLNAAGLAGHPSDGNAWTLSLGIAAIDGSGTAHWVTTSALLIAAGTGWTFVSDIVTIPAGAPTIIGWVQVNANTGGVAPFYGLAANVTFDAYWGTTPLIALPCDTLPGVASPSSIEWDPQERVAESECEFTGQTLVYDWMQSRLDGQVSLPPMRRWSHDAWAAFIRSCRGPLNVFMLGDPKGRLPKGCALGSPVVNGAGQTGYSLLTRGWQPLVTSILLPHDYIQIGWRLYTLTAAVNSDALGNATLPIWPPLRDLPPDGTTIITRNCKGLFRLTNTAGNKDSVNPGSYGLAGFGIKEAI